MESGICEQFKFYPCLLVSLLCQSIWESHESTLPLSKCGVNICAICTLTLSGSQFRRKSANLKPNSKGKPFYFSQFTDYKGMKSAERGQDIKKKEFND